MKLLSVMLSIYVGYWTSMVVTYKCITVKDPKPTIVSSFWSVFSSTAYQMLSLCSTDIVWQEKHCYSSYIIARVLSMVRYFNFIHSKFVKLRFVDDFTSCEIMHYCMASMPIHYPFKVRHSPSLLIIINSWCCVLAIHIRIP